MCAAQVRVYYTSNLAGPKAHNIIYVNSIKVCNLKFTQILYTRIHCKIKLEAPLHVCEKEDIGDIYGFVIDI